MEAKTQYRRFPVSDFNYLVLIFIFIFIFIIIINTNLHYYYLGGQMLRIPIEDVEAEGQISISQQPIASPTLSSRYVRESSPSPSMESVDDTDE
ncbi:hypothetical protein G6011_04474 [Alternaria panax]|uniref:Uncharacterized protein n=1 Tax=Alternaria panax TaxID=48097 RepID=A0AAD4NU81_9PLEO|nr:hypothetical protein G6011_04474 [Alternaria panax]